MVATEHMWLLSVWNAANVMGKLHFTLCLILIHLNLNAHMWLMVTVLGSTDLEKET